MALIDWGASLELGVAVMDEQHRELVAIINRLNEVNAAPSNPVEMERIFAELIKYTKTHFSTEEELMRGHAIALLAEHQTEHRRFIKVVSEFQAKYARRHQAVSVAMMGFLREWLAHHILDVDKQLARALNDLGVH